MDDSFDYSFLDATSSESDCVVVTPFDDWDIEYLDDDLNDFFGENNLDAIENEAANRAKPEVSAASASQPSNVPLKKAAVADVKFIKPTADSPSTSGVLKTSPVATKPKRPEQSSVPTASGQTAQAQAPKLPAKTIQSTPTRKPPNTLSLVQSAAAAPKDTVKRIVKPAQKQRAGGKIQIAKNVSNGTGMSPQTVPTIIKNLQIGSLNELEKMKLFTVARKAAEGAQAPRQAIVRKMSAPYTKPPRAAIIQQQSGVAQKNSLACNKTKDLRVVNRVQPHTATPPAAKQSLPQVRCDEDARKNRMPVMALPQAATSVVTPTPALVKPAGQPQVVRAQTGPHHTPISVAVLQDKKPIPTVSSLSVKSQASSAAPVTPKPLNASIAKSAPSAVVVSSVGNSALRTNAVTVASAGIRLATGAAAGLTNTLKPLIPAVPTTTATRRATLHKDTHMFKLGCANLAAAPLSGAAPAFVGTYGQMTVFKSVRSSTSSVASTSNLSKLTVRHPTVACAAATASSLELRRRTLSMVGKCSNAAPPITVHFSTIKPIDCTTTTNVTTSLTMSKASKAALPPPIKIVSIQHITLPMPMCTNTPTTSAAVATLTTKHVISQKQPTPKAVKQPQKPPILLRRIDGTDIGKKRVLTANQISAIKAGLKQVTTSSKMPIIPRRSSTASTQAIRSAICASQVVSAVKLQNQSLLKSALSGKPAPSPKPKLDSVPDLIQESTSVPTSCELPKNSKPAAGIVAVEENSSAIKTPEKTVLDAEAVPGKQRRTGTLLDREQPPTILMPIASHTPKESPPATLSTTIKAQDSDASLAVTVAQTNELKKGAEEEMPTTSSKAKVGNGQRPGISILKPKIAAKTSGNATVRISKPSTSASSPGSMTNSKPTSVLKQYVYFSPNRSTENTERGVFPVVRRPLKVNSVYHGKLPPKPDSAPLRVVMKPGPGIRKLGDQFMRNPRNKIILRDKTGRRIVFTPNHDLANKGLTQGNRIAIRMPDGRLSFLQLPPGMRPAPNTAPGAPPNAAPDAAPDAVPDAAPSPAKVNATSPAKVNASQGVVAPVEHSTPEKSPSESEMSCTQEDIPENKEIKCSPQSKVDVSDADIYASSGSSSPVSSLDQLSTKNKKRELRKHCNCSKSQCLKLYCDCFANGEFCHDCSCKDCCNNLQYINEREDAIEACLERNPNAFKPKITAGMKSDVRLHNKGCNCKRSNCLKNYCECYEARIPCSATCKCMGCRNTDSKIHYTANVDAAIDLQQIKNKFINLAGESKRHSVVDSSVVYAILSCLASKLNDPNTRNKLGTDMEYDVLVEFDTCMNEVFKHIGIKEEDYNYNPQEASGEDELSEPTESEDCDMQEIKSGQSAYCAVAQKIKSEPVDLDTTEYVLNSGTSVANHQIGLEDQPMIKIEAESYGDMGSDPLA